MKKKTERHQDAADRTVKDIRRQTRKRYMRFREFLRDNAFEMAQYSVYVKHTNGKDAYSAIIRKVEAAMPPEGKVDIFLFTDKQYKNVVCLRGHRKELP